jgi:type I restriction enzyme M protein
MALADKSLDVPALETWLWDAACQIRGPLDAPKFKDYILPLIFLKRLSDVFDDEMTRRAIDLGIDDASDIVEADHALVRFYVPRIARWSEIRRGTRGLGERLTDAVRAVSRENPKLQGVIDVTDFNAQAAGQPIVDDQRLTALVETLSRHRLGLRDVDADILGRAYEYLLRKFAEGQGQSAGEFYTPPEVGQLMARLLEPEPGMTVYDPCCGSGGLLIKCHQRLLESHGIQTNSHRELPSNIESLRLFGQEINPSTFAMARMNAFIHDMDAQIALGDSMHSPKFTTSAGRLKTFDLVIANPMWNQDFDASTYENDGYERFRFGIPPASTADWGWIQHMMASLTDGGRMAVVLDTGSVGRGSGNQGSNKERDIRKAVVDADLVEAVLLLPENLFYNTSAPGLVLVINRRKLHRGEVLMINASGLFTKGRPKNAMQSEQIAIAAEAYRSWSSVERLAAVISTEYLATNDYNLSPSRYVAGEADPETVTLEEAVVLLREADEERAEADAELRQALSDLGF